MRLPFEIILVAHFAQCLNLVTVSLKYRNFGCLDFERDERLRKLPSHPKPVWARIILFLLTDRFPGFEQGALHTHIFFLLCEGAEVTGNHPKINK